VFLSADEIRAEADRGNLRLEPFDPRLLKPASYVLRLGDRVRRWAHRTEPIRPWSPNACAGALSKSQVFQHLTLSPGDFVLLATRERIGISGTLAAIIFPLSHLARFGLTIHLGAAFVSPGFGFRSPTPLTLEVTSHNPCALELNVGMPICQLAITRTLGSRSTSLLGLSVYEGEEAPSPPQLFEEFRHILGTNGNGAL